LSKNSLPIWNDNNIIKVFDIYGNLIWGFNVSSTGSVPTISDLDKDGSLEIIFPTHYNYGNEPLYINVLSANGSIYGNWPLRLRAPYKVSVITADLDNDNDNELIFSTNDSIKAFHHNKTKMWEYYLPNRNLPNRNYPSGFLIAGDVNKDSSPEILFYDSEKSLYILDSNGDVVRGFPINYYDIISEISLANLDDDEELEIIFGGRNLHPSDGNDIHAINYDGTYVDGWPISVDMIYNKGYIIGDIDEDGLSEIVTNGVYGIQVINNDGTTLLNMEPHLYLQ